MLPARGNRSEIPRHVVRLIDVSKRPSRAVRGDLQLTRIYPEDSERLRSIKRIDLERDLDGDPLRDGQELDAGRPVRVDGVEQDARRPIRVERVSPGSLEDPVKGKDVGPEVVPHRKRSVREDIEPREVGGTDGTGVAELIRRRSDEGAYEQEGKDKSHDLNPSDTPDRWLRVDQPVRRGRLVRAGYADCGMPKHQQDDPRRRNHGGKDQCRSHPGRDGLEDAALGDPGDECPVGKPAAAGERVGEPTVIDQHVREGGDPESQGHPSVPPP